ncbi:MAG: RluA family pseudouridine synthase [Bacteroidales bacterium]|nr:RluA family pseudouridine synthase [Candidatus Colimorpha onthohippi]
MLNSEDILSSDFEQSDQISEDLYEHHHIVVDRGQESMRLDKFLQLRLQGISRTKIQAATKANCVRVNDNPVKSSYKIKPLDVISVLLPEPPHETELCPEQMPLNIVYEDDDVLVIEKQPGLVVHPGVGNFTGTLLNGLLFHMGVGQVAPQPASSSKYPYLVHRIDKDTSGLLLVAKNEDAQVMLAKQFFDHTIDRKYSALVWGDFREDSGTVVGNLDRSPKDRRVMAVCDDDHGKHAVTHWRVIERFGYVTLVECVLETGRTHQIRAHMKHIGHPLFSDAAYGGDQILKGTTFSHYKQFVENTFRLLPRQALHAKLSGFEHPTTHQRLLFESPLPPDFQSALQKWRAYATGSNSNA